jgi:AAA domain, putative AbiEii toxin, Type IV TA system
MPQIDFKIGIQQGPLPQGFQINLEGSYITLVGANNTAKTSLLTAIFKQYYQQFAEPNRSKLCFILPERIYVDVSSQPQGYTIEQYNNQLATTIGGSNKNYHTWDNNLPVSVLPKVLLNHSDFLEQFRRLNTFLEYFGLPKIKLRGNQEMIFEQVQVIFQGSGLRSILAILAALTDDTMQTILIDEPEQSLEAGIQKRLRDLFYTASSEQGKQIIVSTHSHLFLNRRDFASNYAVTKEHGQVNIRRVASEKELLDITFSMLGNSVEDLFFPGNFLIVEGATDQIIVEKVMELKGIDRARIKVASAAGVDKVPNILTAIYTNLLPLVIGNSPYKDTIVVLIDKPYDKQTNSTYAKIKAAVSSEQLLELTDTSLETYLPESLYARSGRNKAEVIRDIEKEQDYQRKFQLKTENARAIAVVLTREDFPNIQIIVDAVDRTLSRTKN